MARVNENFLKLASGYLFPEINRRKSEWAKNNPGISIYSLGIGNTTEELGPSIASAMIEKVNKLSNRNTYTGYGDEQGDAELRRKLASFYEKEYGVFFPLDYFFVSDGAKSDAANISEIFSQSSVVAITDPAYPVYVDSTVASGKSGNFNGNSYDGIVYMDAREDDGFLPRPPKVKVDLIYLCSPNNPTGAVFTAERLQEFIDYAIVNKAIIIFDAAYSDYIRDEGFVRSIYQLDGAEKCAIEINSFSKNAGFTGVRLGWSVVPKTLVCENEEEGVVNRLWNRRQTTFFNGASNISQAGGIAALKEEGRRECRRLVDYYLENARIIKTNLEDIGLMCYGGANSPYIWAKCPNGLSSWDFFDFLLAKAHVIVTPGSGFGKNGEGFVRLSSYGHREDIIQAVNAIKEAMNE